MSQNFESRIRSLRLWEFIDQKMVISKEPLLQAEILEFASKHQLGSRKTILNIINQFLEAKMIEKIELAPLGPGRPRIAYQRSFGKNEALLLNLAPLPEMLVNYISHQAEKKKIGKGEALIGFLSWAYFQLLHNLNNELIQPIKAQNMKKIQQSIKNLDVLHDWK